MINDVWQLICFCLVLLLGVGLVLFYSGAVREKNSVTVLIQSLVIFCGTFLIWSIGGYNLIFFGDVFFEGEFSYSHFLYQYSFFFVAVLIPLGSMVERVPPLSAILFCLFWGVACYLPVAYSVWNSDAWIHSLGVYDFAGGIVVHISSGAAGLAAAMMAGRRADLYKLRLPFNLPQIYIGFFFIVLGWLGFNSGSLPEFSVSTGSVMVATILSVVGGCLGWGLLDMIYPPNRISIMGMTFGGVCGLVSVTPGAFGLSLFSAFLLGFFTAIVCFYISQFLRKILRIDDALDVFTSHGIAGVFGAVTVAILGNSEIVKGDVLYGNIVSSALVLCYSFVISLLIIVLLKKFIGFHVRNSDQEQGIDIVYHGEKPINIK